MKTSEGFEYTATAMSLTKYIEWINSFDNKTAIKSESASQGILRTIDTELLELTKETPNEDVDDFCTKNTYTELTYANYVRDVETLFVWKLCPTGFSLIEAFIVERRTQKGL